MTIRVGLVGTNTSHAEVFAGLLNGEKGTEPRVAGGRVTGVWPSREPGLSGAHPDGAEFATRFGIDQMVGEADELVGAVDAVLVVDDLEGGALHARLATPFLKAGLPTFVDKPMTLGVSDAVALFDLAERNSAPLMSSSALRFAPELAVMLADPARVGKLSSVVSVGPGDWYNYGIHAVEVAQAIAGSGASWVHQHASSQRDVTVVGYDAGPTAVIETLRDASYLFHVVAYGENGSAQADIADFPGFYAGTMTAFLEMVRTGHSPVSRADTLEILAILEAGRRSAGAGASVRISDLLSEASR